MTQGETSIAKGMAVRGADGTAIGTVTGVWSVDAYRHGHTEGHFPTQGEDTADTGVHETEQTGQGAIFCVTVDGGAGISVEHLYVPFGAVDTVTSNDGVVLRYGAAESGDLFARMPDFLQTTIEHQPTA